ncbi:MAG: DNRLRE domain-containing protein, partial [Bacteroidota bacterium]
SIFPSKDNSIYGNVDQSNGAGTNLFAGTIANAVPRRALLAFDLSSIPQGAIITEVRLNFNVNQVGSQSVTTTFNLHRLTSDWGEAGSVGGGQGGTPQTGDATWFCNFFGAGSCQTSWTTAGGDFLSLVSGSLTMTGTGPKTFQSTPNLVADVQAWLDGTFPNFGWILKSDEVQQRQARRINSRESSSNQPELVVTFSTLLPVELTDFSGQVRGGSHLLNWETQVESGFSHFILERSTNDGQSFQSITQYRGKGNENIGARYSHEEPITNAATSVYRLRMVDLDGSEELSPVVALSGAAAQTRRSLEEITLWPNPAQDHLFVSLTDHDPISLISIWRTDGQLIKQWKVIDDEEQALFIGDLQPGSYLLQLITQQQSVSRLFNKGSNR